MVHIHRMYIKPLLKNYNLMFKNSKNQEKTMGKCCPRQRHSII